MQIRQEINHVLEKYGYDQGNVSWIGSRDGSLAMSLPDFLDRFGNANYDDGFGSQEVASDLVMVIDEHNWFYREEYDGAEGWEFAYSPVKQRTSKPYEKIIGDGWDSLKQLQEDDGNV